MSKQVTLNLWPIMGINVFNLPKQYMELFPKHSANEEDCIPPSEQDKAEPTGSTVVNMFGDGK